MSFIETLAAQRQKLLDGLDANEGDINLRIFEDFYPDEAHFIYELLQNAEDAGATEAKFELSAHSCSFEHNGKRCFDERDIRSITGIFNSSKKHNPDKIGKFGVGFKSVFVYTDTPTIYSKDYSFKIIKLVMPQSVQPKTDIDGRTRFEFPFNNPKKSLKEAYAEIKTGLEQLSETTLLFLNNLRCIGWRVGEREGEVLREEHSEVHIEVLKVVEGNETLSSHWLRFSAPVNDIHRFTAPVEGVERQKVSVAYELEFTGGAKSHDPKKPLSKQLRVRPSQKGKVAVFFPAEKENSGLRFHLHAPFIPELSRASIKNSPENTPLFEQLASVAAESLHDIKKLGLLTGEFLAVLPNNDELLPDRYKLIRNAIIDEMKSQELVPTYSGGHAPAIRLVQARAAIKSLLSDDDLAFVLCRKDLPRWVIGATQKNNLVDKYLNSLDIPTWDVEDLKEYLESNTCQPSHSWQPRKLNQEVINWLSNHSSGWHQALYAVIGKYCEDEGDFGFLDEAYIVRMADGSYQVAKSAYFQTDSVRKDDPLPRVDESVLTEGTKKAQQADARKFLIGLGVKTPGELEEIELVLRTRYGEDSDEPSDKIYRADLKRFIAFTERNLSETQAFSSAYIFRIESEQFSWASPTAVYLDSPFLNTSLRYFYSKTIEHEKQKWPLSDWYKNCGIPLEKIAKFAQFCGCKYEFEGLSIKANCTGNPKWNHLSKAPGERYGNYVNRDCALSRPALQMLQTNQLGASLLVWNALSKSSSSVLTARYQMNDRGGSRFADSQLICTLKELPWVPQTGGRFVKPREAVQKLLPKGFTVDAGYKWLELVEFGADEKKKVVDTAIRAQKRKELGFASDEAFERALAFANLPAAAQERFLSSIQSQEESVELPERQVRNGEIRSQRVGDQAKQTPDKASIVKPRSTQLGLEAAKADAKIYLRDQYTNGYGQMVCQVCKDEMPFKLPNGSYYFEAVEILNNSPKRFREGYLCLCPNHAAAYQFANAQKETMSELIAMASGNEVELELGGVQTTVYFTQMHLADVKSCFSSLVDEA